MKLKKFAIAALVCSMALSFAACGKKNNDPSDDPTKAPEVTKDVEPTTAPTDTPAPTEAPVPTDAPAEDGVMTYAEYVAAELESQVTITAYVQAKQSWWDNKATVYTQDADGAYFLYNMACSEEDYAKLVPGTQIKVTGYKSEWSGEVEIIDATFEILAGSTMVYPATDVTALLGTEDLIKAQNQFVAFKGMTVEAAGQNDAGEGVAFLYNWDGSGEDGSDLYFNVSLNGTTYTFTVESYLCDKNSDVYAAVKNLKIGDVIDMEGFLYWYNGVNPHITSVAVAASAPVDNGNVKSEGVMTYAEYVAAELDSPVVIEAYVQAKQSWWDNKATVYTQDEDGAYFLYNMACSEEDYAKLVAGTKIKVTGYKSEWSGEVEIIDATFEIEDGSFIAEAKDVTALLGTDALIDSQNQLVAFTGMTVVAAGQNDVGEDVAFLYNWDGSGEDGNDLYFNVSLNDQTYTFTVESYLCDKNSDVYAAVKNLKIGDVIDMEGFLYWYNGVNPHITSVTVVKGAEVADSTDTTDTSDTEKKTEFLVTLAEVGENKIQVIKAVRELTGLGLKEAKDLVDNAPSTLASALSEEDANNYKTTLEALGATVEIEEK